MKMYIVKYSKGSYDDEYEINIFVTAKKQTAINYAKKFNRILKKYKNFYKKFEIKKGSIIDLKPEYFDKYFGKWYELSETSECYYEEIEMR